MEARYARRYDKRQCWHERTEEAGEAEEHEERRRSEREEIIRRPNATGELIGLRAYRPSEEESEKNARELELELECQRNRRGGDLGGWFGG